MIEFYQGESIPIRLPLVEYSTRTPIDTDDLTGVTISVKDTDGNTLKEGTLSAGTVTKSGQYVNLFIESTVTASADPGVYKVYVVVTKPDSRFSNDINVASYFDKMFKIKTWSG